MADSNPETVTLEPTTDNEPGVDRVIQYVYEALEDYLEEPECYICCLYCPCCIFCLCCPCCPHRFRSCVKRSHYEITVLKSSENKKLKCTEESLESLRSQGVMTTTIGSLELLPDQAGTTLRYHGDVTPLPDYTLYLCTDTRATRGLLFATRFLYAWYVNRDGQRRWFLTTPSSATSRTTVTSPTPIDITTQVNSSNPVGSIEAVLDRLGFRGPAFQWTRRGPERNFQVCTTNRARYWRAPDGSEPAVQLIPNAEANRAQLRYRED